MDKRLYMKRIAVFISGSGTNAENIIQYFEKNDEIDVALVLSDRAEAFGLQRAKRLGVPTHVFDKKAFLETNSIVNLLSEQSIDFIVLAGFLSYVPFSLISNYPKRIINIHPSLLPKYGGKGMYGSRVHQAVIEHKEHESGITIHYLNEKFDEGEIIFQAKCPVLSTDTVKEVESKVRRLEIKHYPEVIEEVISSL